MRNSNVPPHPGFKVPGAVYAVHTAELIKVPSRSPGRNKGPKMFPNACGFNCLKLRQIAVHCFLSQAFETCLITIGQFLPFVIKVHFSHQMGKSTK